MMPAAIRLRGGERLIPEEFDRRAFMEMNARIDALASATEADEAALELMEPCS